MRIVALWVGMVVAQVTASRPAPPPRITALSVTPAPHRTRPASAPPLEAGWAFHYRPGLMRLVASVRHLGWRADVDGYASTRHCNWIGQIVTAVIDGQRVRLWQVDCSDPRDLSAQDQRGLVVEVDWSLAHLQGWATYNGDRGPGRARASLIAHAK